MVDESCHRTAFLLAYFQDEGYEHGEQIRFAVSDDDTPARWTELRGGRPILRPTGGECGVRDPFLVRDERRGSS